jgi:hypothetical protein
MIIELLTPLMLTTVPVSLTEVAPTVYDHSAQRVISEAGSEYKQTAQYRTVSGNGTQTYAYNGRPFDADNDSD